MKIRKLIIKNYKIFDDVEFDFTDAKGNTLDTVVLAGTNGCGKTTVLEIIKDILLGGATLKSEKKSPVIIDIQLTKAEVKYLKGYLVSRFFKDKNEDDWAAKLDHLPIVSSKDEGPFNWFIRSLQSPPYPTVFTYFPVKAGKKVDHPKFPFVKILHPDHQKADMKKNALKEIRDEIFKNRETTPLESIQQHIKKITHALADLDLNTSLVDLESEELIFESANGQLIYFDELSHGEQHLYFRAIYLSQLNLRNGIIMVDEPEAAFHPTWQQKIAQLYSKVGKNNQVFMATHSPHIMASVPPECLFVLHIDESEGKRKIRVVNAAKAGQHSQGLEPNRILKEVMQVETLREYETQRDIERLTTLLTFDDFQDEEAENLTEKLTLQLGRQDPFIIRLEHQLLMLRRKKENQTPAYAAT